jgi:hypothetical protein
MAEKKGRGGWQELINNSKASRRKFDSLLAEIEKASTDANTDLIRFYTALCHEVGEWKRSFEEKTPGLSQFISEMQPRYEKEAEQLIDRLRSSLTERRHTVYGEESMLVVDGIVHVECNAKAGDLRVNGKPQPTVLISDLIIEIEKEVDSLRRNATPQEEFAKFLLCGYRTLVATRGLHFGTQVETLDLVPYIAFQKQSASFRNNPIGKTFLDYPLSQFRADLHNALTASSADADGNMFKIASGSSTKGAVFMFVPALGRTAHVGRVWFDKAMGKTE